MSLIEGDILHHSLHTLFVCKYIGFVEDGPGISAHVEGVRHYIIICICNIKINI